MSHVLQANNLFEHMRHICERPRMFSPDFTLAHLFMFIQGYEAALGDRDQPSQHERFRNWLYKRKPEWGHSSAWWGRHVFEECAGDLERTLDEINKLLGQFLASTGAEFLRSPTQQSDDP
jgi:hypothetical protein